jgi:hypothetical protein
VENTPSHIELKKSARTAGILYLLIILTAGFAEGAVRGAMVVPGDATATASNIIGGESLFRLGFAADLVAFLADTAVSILLYLLLKPVSRSVALIAASFRLLAHPAIGAVNLLNHFAPIMLLNGAYGETLGAGQVEALSLFFLEAHGIGYLIAGAFFGVHCLLLGWLLYRSPLFPTLLGIFLAVAALGYLIESFGTFLAPQHQQIYAWIVLLPAVVAELSLCLWLLIKGVRREPAQV